MTATQALAVFVTTTAAVVAVAFFYAGVRVRRRTSVSPDEGSPFARELAEEVRKWQAEAGYWKRTSERLQRELDQRPVTGPDD